MATETKAKNENQSFLKSSTSYLRAVKTELDKVSWPDRDEVVGLTRIVLLVTAVTSLGLGAVSIFLTWFLDNVGFEFPIVLVVLFIIIAVVTWWSFQRGESKSY